MIRLALVLALVVAPSVTPSTPKPQQTTKPSSQPQVQETNTQGHAQTQGHAPVQETQPKAEAAAGEYAKSIKDKAKWQVMFQDPAYAQIAEQLPPAGPPRLIDSALFDGGHNNIDKGELMTFTPQGGRFEVWEVQKNVSMDHAKVVAFDPSGAELWRTKFQWGSGESWGKHLASTVDFAGDFYFMYITMGAGSSYKWRIVKVTKAGAVAWHKTLYTTTWGKEATYMAAHPQGGVVVASAASGQVRDLYTARVSSAGDVLWEKKYDYNGENQFPDGLVVASDGSIYVVCDDNGLHVRKYSADGEIRWTHDYMNKTPYERLKGRDAYLDPAGDLVVAGTTYSGGSEDDWVFVNKYTPQGALLQTFVSTLTQQEGKLSDWGLQTVHAAHGADGAVYFAWDDNDQLDTKWWLRRVVVPVRSTSSGGQNDYGLVSLVKQLGYGQTISFTTPAQVSWTKTFEADKAMSVEKLVWIGNGAIGVLGRGKRKIGTNDFRADIRLRAIKPDGVDLGAAVFGSPGNFNNEPFAIGIGREAMVHVLGWQYWNGDGWNDENVLRLRFQLKYQPPPN